MAFLERFVENRPASADAARRKAVNAQFAARVVAAVAVGLLIFSLLPPDPLGPDRWVVPLLVLGFLWTALHVRALDLRRSYWDLRDEAGDRDGAG